VGPPEGKRRTQSSKLKMGKGELAGLGSGAPAEAGDLGAALGAFLVRFVGAEVVVADGANFRGRHG